MTIPNSFLVGLITGAILYCVVLFCIGAVGLSLLVWFRRNISIEAIHRFKKLYFWWIAPVSCAGLVPALNLLWHRQELLIGLKHPSTPLFVLLLGTVTAFVVLWLAYCLVYNYIRYRET